MSFKVGDKVVKNDLTWTPNDFDSWGRGIGIGVVLATRETWPEMLSDGEVDVRWENGRCFEYEYQLRLLVDI